MLVTKKPFYATVGLSLMVILLSVIVTAVILTVVGTDNFLRGIITAIVVPLVVAPGVAYYYFYLFFELEATKEKLEVLSEVDSLTQIHNRRHLMELAVRILEMAKQQNQTVSLLLLDLDHFKQVNDNHGHLTGDRALANFANTVKKCIRKEDIFGRFGGEEFLVLLPDTELQQAQEIASRICDDVADARIITDEGSIQVTVSIGVSHTKAGHYLIDELIHYADQALYDAKDLGRNRCQIAETMRMRPMLFYEG